MVPVKLQDGPSVEQLRSDRHRVTMIDSIQRIQMLDIPDSDGIILGERARKESQLKLN